MLAPGCVVVDMGVTNPVVGLSKVAVVPFFNLSTEPAADGRHFAEAYFTELQKIPGFQVLPIGVTEAAIQDQRLNVQNPEDAIKLAQLLGVDAIVIGAITDYNPYYPMRVGLQVSWFSAHPWAFSPGIPIEPFAQRNLEAEVCPENECEPTNSHWGRFKHWLKGKVRKTYAEEATLFRGQSESVFPPRPTATPGHSEPPYFEEPPPRPLIPPSPSSPDMAEPTKPNPLSGPPADKRMAVPHEPLMSYTRLFDGSDAEVTATLRDYLELREDLRSGGWEAWLHRPQAFIRFATHRMIVEMLALHGGETRRRVVFIWRRYK